MKKLALVFGLTLGSFFTFASETKVLASGPHWNLTAVIEGDTTFVLKETRKRQMDKVVLTTNKENLIQDINKTHIADWGGEERLVTKKRAKQISEAVWVFEHGVLPTGGFKHGISKSGEAVVVSTGIIIGGTAVAVVVAAPAVAVVAGVWGFVHLVAHI